MNGCNPAYLLFCYIRFNPLALEITNLFLSIIGGGFTFFGSSKIPFYIDSNIYKIIFYFNIPYFIIIILLNIIFLFFRFLNLMNNVLNLWGYGLSIFEIYTALFGIVTNLINDSIIISNIRYYQELSLKRKSPKYPLIPPEQLLYTKIVLPLLLFLWINMILIALNDNLLINIKISGSYHTYELALENEKIYSEKQYINNDNDSNDDNQKNNNKNINVKVNINNNNINNNINTNINNNINNNNGNNNEGSKNNQNNKNNDNDSYIMKKMDILDIDIISSVNKLNENDNNNLEENLTKNEEKKK